MTGTLTRPNSNYVLSIMRDDDMADPWGTAISWAFGVAEVLYAAGEDVPDEMGFEPSPYVVPPRADECPEEYPDAFVWEFLDWPSQSYDNGYADRVRELQTAGRCLARYLDWCKSAGLNY